MLPTYFEIKFFFIIAGIPPWDTGSSLFKASFYISSYICFLTTEYSSPNLK
jgi:hypothetical protein